VAVRNAGGLGGWEPPHLLDVDPATSSKFSPSPLVWVSGALEGAHFVWDFDPCTGHLHSRLLPRQPFLVPFSVTP
jgi:hypothetical protein